MPGTETLLGLWLRELKPKRCAAMLNGWRAALLNRGPAANENLSPDMREERVAALKAIDRACETCTRVCPNRIVPAAPVSLKVLRARDI